MSRTLVKFTCKLCGKQQLVNVTLARTRKYCSYACRDESRRIPRKVVICKQCGREKLKDNYLKGQFCSPRCASLSRVHLPLTAEQRQRASIAGRLAYMEGRRVSGGGNRSRRTTYGSICFRSRTEARVAELLDRQGVSWVYELKRFDLDSTTYLPDFYLPDLAMYLEVKGYIEGEKVPLFREKYPELKILVVFQRTVDATWRGGGALCLQMSLV